MTSTLLALSLTLSPVADARTTIETMHRDHASALVAKDYLAIERIIEKNFSRDFLWKKLDQPTMRFADLWEMNRADMELKKQGKADGPLKFVPKLTNWKIGPQTAFVTVTNTGHGEWLKDGRRLPVVFRIQVREMWVREKDGWKARRFDELNVRGTVDGKPFPPK